ncbi:MAG: arginine--tRNA ligase [Candidatus Magasanikbacteria bacterium]|nr:arginine--tRNA ligase [Candidatus Magasanikbacteria bacterium]
MIMKPQVEKILREAGVIGEIEFTIPPNAEMGDLAFACFGLAKEWKMNPAEAAKKIIVEAGRDLPVQVERIEAVGPYVNFYFNASELAKLVLGNYDRDRSRPVRTIRHVGRGKKTMVEFAHPNTHKPVHIGHLRNMITGESLVRILENQGNKVVRANYQGDVGMHIAKCLWGILRISDFRFQISDLKRADERARFLGETYAMGGQAFEKDETAKKEIEALNIKIYNKNKSVWGLYKKTRKWSLDYFDYIYKKVGVKKFDRLYFESETFELGKKIVLAGLKKDIFKASQGAIIFEGSKYGLHDRVFISSKGLPTYEAKDQGLAALQFKEYHPDYIYHVVGKEQADYFKVVFKALEFTLPESKGKEKHLVYGWVSLKEGKMSSRTGNVVLAEWLLDEVEKRITEIMRDREIKNKEKVIKKVANAAVKYSMLKTGIGNDIVFDFNESVSLSGDSGPYLLYIVARINSILKKSKFKNQNLKFSMPTSIEPEEKKLLLGLVKFEEVVREAGEKKDPSVIAKYLFGLAQGFNNFYQSCPVLEAEPAARVFRLRLIKKTKEIMESGLNLLGIETVEEM